MYTTSPKAQENTKGKKAEKKVRLGKKESTKKCYFLGTVS